MPHQLLALVSIKLFKCYIFVILILQMALVMPLRLIIKVRNLFHDIHHQLNRASVNSQRREEQSIGIVFFVDLLLQPLP